ncbi:MAG: hypothetical protein JST00_00605 [Deltaproteobacteria bacterium]|nr:hypothetical protein [Deltaproteobacteria bacterium]
MGPIAEVVRRGKAAWPDVDVDVEAFARAFAGMALASAGEAALEAAHDDVFLACACLAGSDSARLAFERAIMVDVPQAIRRVDADATFVDDVTSDLRVALLGADAGAAGLGRYVGRGPLRSYVMVLAMRRALDRKRRQREVLVDADDFEALLGSPDASYPPADAGTPAELKRAFALACKESLALLEARDRNLLRMHFVDGVPAEALARMYNVHRATMTRWIASARESVFAMTRELMARDHAFSPETFASFARSAAGLDATLSTFLGDTESPEKEPSRDP